MKDAFYPSNITNPPLWIIDDYPFKERVDATLYLREQGFTSLEAQDYIFLLQQEREG